MFWRNMGGWNILEANANLIRFIMPPYTILCNIVYLWLEIEEKAAFLPSMRFHRFHSNEMVKVSPVFSRGIGMKRMGPGIQKGGTQIWTGGKGFAIPCLTTWLYRHNLTFPPHEADLHNAPRVSTPFWTFAALQCTSGSPSCFGCICTCMYTPPQRFALLCTACTTSGVKVYMQVQVHLKQLRYGGVNAFNDLVICKGERKAKFCSVKAVHMKRWGTQCSGITFGCEVMNPVSFGAKT